MISSLPATEASTRREFLRGVSAAALATLAADECAWRLRLRNWSIPGRLPTPASSSGWPAAWRRRRPSIPSATRPFEVGVPSEKILCTFPAIDTVVDNIKISQGLENIAQRHGPGHADPFARGRRPGQHPPLPPSVSLAHRLCPAADGRLPAHRLVDRPRPRPEQPGHSAVHQHRPTARGRRRIGRAEGVHHGRLLRQRVRPVQPAVSRRTPSPPCVRRRA